MLACFFVKGAFIYMINMIKHESNISITFIFLKAVKALMMWIYSGLDSFVLFSIDDSDDRTVVSFKR